MIPSHLVETGQLFTTTVLLLPLREQQEGRELYWEYLKGKFDLSKDTDIENIQ